MAFNARVGKAVLELSIDSGAFVRGAGDAQKVMRDMRRGIEQFHRDVNRTAFQFGGREQLADANKLTHALQQHGLVAKLTATEKARVNAQLTEAIAKYRALGQAAPKALLDVEKATRTAERATGSFLTRNVAFGAFLGTFAANLGTRAVHMLANIGREAFATAGRIADLADKTGLSMRTIQQMDYVAGQTSSTLEGFSEASFRLSDRIANGSASVRQASADLRIEFDRLRASTPDEQWNRVVLALGQVQDQGERTRLGMILFGRSFGNVATAVAADYQNLARQARVMSDESIKALDRNGDAVERFVKNSKTLLIDGLGGTLRGIEAVWEKILPVVDSQGRAVRFVGDGMSMARIAAERAAAATAQAGAAAESYQQRLAKVQQQLARLTPAQRREIDAALKLGAETAKLEDQYGLSAGALRIYTGEMREASKASGALAKSQADVAREAEEANRRWLDILGAMDAAEIRRKRSPLTIADNLGPQFPQPTPEDAIAALEAEERAAAKLREHTNFIEERRMEDEARRLAALRAQRDRFLGPWRDLAERTLGAGTSNLFTMITGFGTGDEGAKQRAREARQYYEQLQASGTASAEAITQAFAEMHRAEAAAQNRFSDRFKGWLGGLLREFRNWIDQMVGAFVGELLGGFARALARSKIGQAVIGWATSLIPGLAAKSVLDTSLLTASLAGSTAAAASTAAASGTAAAGVGTAAAAGGAGLGATLAGLATNPFTIGAAAILALDRFVFGPGRNNLRNTFAPARQLPPRTMHTGGVVGEGATPMSSFVGRLNANEVLIKALKGEGVLTPRATAAIGGRPAIEALNRGTFTNRLNYAGPRFELPAIRVPEIARPAPLMAPAATGRSGGGGMDARQFGVLMAAVQRGGNNITIHAMDGVDVERVLRKHGPKFFKKAMAFNWDGLGTEITHRVLEGG